MRRKTLEQTKRLLSRKSKSIYNLQFNKLESAKYFLARDLSNDNLNVAITSFVCPEVASATPMASQVFVYCPLRGRSTACAHCSFRSGYVLNIFEVLIFQKYDTQKVTKFINTQTRVRFSFACRKVIVPRYRTLQNNVTLIEFVTGDPYLKIGLFDFNTRPVSFTKSIYPGHIFHAQFRLQKNDGFNVLTGVLDTLQSKDVAHDRKLLLGLIALRGIPYTKFASVLKLLHDRRLKLRSMYNLTQDRQFPEELHRFGYYSKSNRRYYHSRKFKKVLRNVLTVSEYSDILGIINPERKE